jgi:DNA repair exonuclease SbcCD ATPase subunit
MSEAIMIKEATPKKVAFVSKPYSREEKIKKDEEELQKLKDEQKGKTEEDKVETEEDKLEKEEPKNAEEKTFKKRYGDLRRHVQQKEQEFQKQIDSLKIQLSESTKKNIKLPKSDEDIESWAKEYPDVAAIVETIATKKAMEQSKTLEERMKSIDEMQVSAVKEKAEAALMRMHPDFDTIRDSDEFHEWAEEQPKWIQDALYDNANDARSASRAIDLYKADKNITSKKPASKDAAKAINAKSGRTAPDTNDTSGAIKESDVQKMSTRDYEKHSEEIMEAIRSGNFIYDLSGNAR